MNSNLNVCIYLCVYILLLPSFAFKDDMIGFKVNFDPTKEFMAHDLL